MNKHRLLDYINIFGLIELTEHLSKHFPYTGEEIFNVILMLDSVDDALQVLSYCEENENLSINEAVYLILHARDEKEN